MGELLKLRDWAEQLDAAYVPPPPPVCTQCKRHFFQGLFRRHTQCRECNPDDYVWH